MAIEFGDLFEWSWEPRQLEAIRVAENHRFPLYGGSRGPGKSFWLRWGFVRLHLKWAVSGITNVRTMLACEDYPRLYDRHIVKITEGRPGIERFPSWLGEYRVQKREFAFHKVLRVRIGEERFELPLGGAIALRNLSDVGQFAGAEFAAIGIDELTEHHDRRTFDMLRGSLRWPGIERCPLWTAAMPTGPGLNWVRTLWKERDFPPEYAEIADEFALIQSYPQDNPHLSDGYWSMLRSQPPSLQKAWLEGDWYSGIEGAMYPDFSAGPGGNVTEEAEFVPGQGPIEWWMDDGFSSDHPFYCGIVQVLTDGYFHLFDEYMESHRQHDEVIEALADRGYPIPEIARIPSEAGRLAARLHEAGIRTAKSTHPVEQGAKVARRMICGGSGRRALKIHPRCRMTVQSLSALPEDPKRNGRPLKVSGVPGDHPADAVRYGLWSRRNW